MELIISIFLGILGVYSAVGVLFGLYFMLFGATKMDPFMKETKKGVRLLLFPGVVVTWPFLLKKIFISKTN